MKRALLLTVVTWCVCLATHASENRLIRDDRIWVCTSCERERHVAKYMKFMEDGDFGGKTYTRVATIKRVEWLMDDEDNATVENGVDLTEAWMREEDGVVYLLLDGWVPLTDPDEVPDIQEGVLYDFNAPEHATYGAVSQYRSFEGDLGYYLEGENYVCALATDIVGDDEVQCWEIKFRPTGEDYDPTGPVCPVVEGVGIVEHGCLYYAETYLLTSGFNNYNEFYCYMDSSGNILYPVGMTDELPGGGLTGTPAVQQEVGHIIYDGDLVSCPNASIAVYDMAGNLVVGDTGEVSTSGLRPGIYVASAGAKTLKIIVK